MKFNKKLKAGKIKMAKWKPYTKKDLPALRKKMIKNIQIDSEKNDKIIEKLEDSFHIDLTTYYGEEDPKRIGRLFVKLKKEY